MVPCRSGGDAALGSAGRGARHKHHPGRGFRAGFRRCVRCQTDEVVPCRAQSLPDDRDRGTVNAPHLMLLVVLAALTIGALDSSSRPQHTT